jgi:hypothetical protein
MRPLNVFPVLASKALLAVLLSLRTALAVTLALSSSTEGNFMFDIFEIIDGEDANKFTLKGNELTFKATAFKARNNATYRVNIRATKVENNIRRFDIFYGINKRGLCSTIFHDFHDRRKCQYFQMRIT